MFRIHRILLVLAPLAPLFVLNVIAYWAIVAAISIVIATILVLSDGPTLRQIEARSRPFILVAFFSLALLMAQLVPMAPTSLTYPIWPNASAALGVDLGSRISVDPSSTVQCALQFLFLTAFVFLFASVSIDRTNAQWLFRMTSLAACLLSAFVLANFAARPTGLNLHLLGSGMAPITLIVGAASMLSLRTDIAKEKTAMIWDLSLACAAFVLGLTDLAIERNVNIAMLAVLGAILAWLSCSLPAQWFGRLRILRVLIALAFTACLPFALQLVQHAPMSGLPAQHYVSADTSKRLLADTPLLGTGAGTFTSLARIYSQNDSEGVVSVSLAGKLNVEFGLLGLLAIAFLWLIMTFELLAGALRRYRDRYFCASAWAATMVGSVQAFLDNSWTEPPIQLLVAMLIAIAMVQRDPSHSTRP